MAHDARFREQRVATRRRGIFRCRRSACLDRLGVSAAQKDQWYKHWVAEGLAGVERLLQRYGRGPFCFGAAPTLADCCLIPQVANAERMGCALDAYPRTMAVNAHATAQPAFAAAAPKRQP